jgi:hypothetical protein
MTANQFAEALRACAPAAEQLRRLGLSSAGIEKNLAGYYCKLRPDSSTTQGREPLIELIENYDLSEVDIGSTRFGSTVEKRGPKWRIGTFASDLLVVDPQTGKIQVEEFPSAGHLLWECAESGSEFLDALGLAAAFLSRCSWDVGLYDDQAAHLSVANECTIAAGGDCYRDFYLVLCGCD